MFNPYKLFAEKRRSSENNRHAKRHWKKHGRKYKRNEADLYEKTDVSDAVGGGDGGYVTAGVCVACGGGKRMANGQRGVG